jgi:serine/threonine protein kinase
VDDDATEGVPRSRALGRAADAPQKLAALPQIEEGPGSRIGPYKLLQQIGEGGMGDERRLTPVERLDLFAPVCRAVQHAHSKGVIHRDLKPSNVLVALYDGKPVPKVIDFGIAKATGPKLTERTLFTDFGSVIGTLEYMSPEQSELNQLGKADPVAQNNLAWFLATVADPQFRDPKQAVQIAREVVERVPQNRENWITLGVAQYGARDYRNAVLSLEKAIRGPYRFSGYSALYLAMAYWQLGQKDKASHWYARAIDQMEKRELRDLEHARHRRDAELLMGILAESPRV